MGFIQWLIGEEPNILSLAMHRDTGERGEYLIDYALNNDNLKGKYKTLRNIYIPYRGSTSEIDVLMIHEKGIFVFESKNYSGWIFGSENQRTWTQCLENKSKERFYNPIMQNKTHINALVKATGLSEDKFKSYIVFSERCELKKIPQNTNSCIITRRPRMLGHLRKELKSREIIYTEDEINKLYDLLSKMTNVTDEVKQKHIDDIKSRHKNY